MYILEFNILDEPTPIYEEYIRIALENQNTFDIVVEEITEESEFEYRAFGVEFESPYEFDEKQFQEDMENPNARIEITLCEESF